MALTFNGTSSGLARSGTIVSGYPFTIFAWTKASRLQTGFVAELAVDPGPRGTHEGHGALGDGSRMRAWTSIGSSVSAFSSRAQTTGDWVPCMVVFSSASMRKVYFGSGAVQTETTSVPQLPILLTTFSVGKQAVKAANFWAGDIACVGLWSAELTAAQFGTLSGGVVPSTVQTDALVDYWPLLTQASSQAGINGRVLVATSTVQAANHPIIEDGGGGGSDTTPPTLTGAISVSSISTTGYTLSWPAGSDNVAVSSYETSLNGATNWMDVGNVLSVNISGRTPGTTDQVRVRAKDAAGNVSTPMLSASVTLQTGGDATPPILTGAITVSALTSSSYALGWPAGSDNVAVTGYDLSLDSGTNWTPSGNVLSASVSGRTPGSTDQVRVRARDAAGNLSTPVLSVAVNLPVPGDITPPTLTGGISVSAVTDSSYRLAWPAAADNVAVTAYERSLDGGANWASVGTALSVDVAGRTPGSTDLVLVRARDGAGNVSSPALSTNVTLAVASNGNGTITTPPLKNNTGMLLANLSNVAVNVYNANSGALVVRKTGLSSNAAGMVTITDAAITVGTAYAYEVVTTANGRRLPLGMAA